MSFIGVVVSIGIGVAGGVLFAWMLRVYCYFNGEWLA